MPIKFLKESNYIEDERSEEALEDAIMSYAYLECLPPNLRFNSFGFLQAHYLLMNNLKRRIAGKFRTVPVTVGGSLKPFISRELIEADMALLMMDINKSVKNDVRKSIEEREKICKTFHIRFEYIHPFVDGNGRMGRILLNLHRRALKLPFLVIKESEKDEYYRWFD